MKQLCAALCIFLTINITAQNYEDYNWQHVPIGGGGYITGMQIHPTNAEVRYYRTDVGGAYKWDAASQSLKQIIYSTNDEHYSIAGIALNPNDESQVFLAMSRKCDAANTAIYKSYNYGEDFEVVDGLPFYFAANGGRNCASVQNNRCTENLSDKDRQGTPIAINPLNTNELFIGTRENGLYIMNLNNDSVQQVGINNIKSNDQCYSIRSVVFHPIQKNKVFIGYANEGVFVGNTETGAYWNLDYNDNYPDLKYVSDISVSKNGDYMLVACKKKGIWKCNDPAGTTATWSQVLQWNAAASNTNDDEGYLTVECSPHTNNTAITVTGDVSKISDFEFTTNAGGMWNDKNGNPAINLYGYKKSGFGSHVSQIRFDPNNNKGLYFTSWFSTYHTTDWTVGNINWSNEKSRGHEEIVTTDITAFPKNTANQFLLIHSGDHSGYIYNDISDENYPEDLLRDRVPANQTGGMVKGSNSDFCENDPDNIVCNFLRKWDNSDGSIVVSNDGGVSFTRLSGYNESVGKSLVAMSSSSPNNIVIANKLGLQYLTNTNNNFSNVQGSSAINNLATCNNVGSFTCKAASNLTGNKINTSVFSVVKALAADKVLGCVFYFYDMTDGSFHASTNGGKNWCIVNNTDLPSFGTNLWKHKTRLTAIPGKAKHLWINFNDDLFRSTNGGQNWSKINTVDKTVSIATGKAAPGSNYPTLYLFGKIAGENGNFFYRSTDEGENWTRINENTENELWGVPKIIEADRNVYGRIYAGVSGQGVVYGDIAESIIIDCDNSNIINNPGFEDDFTDWQTRTGNGATASFQVENGGTEGLKQAKITATNIGGNYWDIQIKKQSLFFEEGREYVVQYDIKSNQSAQFSYGSNRKAGGAIMSGTGTASTQWQTVEKSFIANTSDEAQFFLNFGHQANTIFFVDKIQLKKVCDDVDPEPVCNYANVLSNPSFENGLTDWETRNANGSNVNFNTINNADIDGTKIAQVSVSTIGNNYWDIQFKRPNLNFENGVDYTLSFAIKANQNNIQFSYGSNQTMGNVGIFNGTGLATTQWQTVSKTFTANTANTAYLILNFGHQAGIYYIDKVELKKACLDEPAPQPDDCNLVVTNINDSGSNSLKEAINCAVDGATITIHSNLADYNIFIQNSPIIINKNLTIESDADMPTFLNATNVQRVFEVQADANLTLRNLNLVGGQADTGNVIDNEGAVIMQNGEIFNCIINPFPENPRLGGNGDYTLLPDVVIHK